MNPVGMLGNPFGIRIVKSDAVPRGRMFMFGAETILVKNLPCFECMGRGWLRPPGWPWVSEMCGTCRGLGYES